MLRKGSKTTQTEYLLWTKFWFSQAGDFEKIISLKSFVRRYQIDESKPLQWIVRKIICESVHHEDHFDEEDWYVTEFMDRCGIVFADKLIKIAQLLLNTSQAQKDDRNKEVTDEKTKYYKGASKVDRLGEDKIYRLEDGTITDKGAYFFEKLKNVKLGDWRRLAQEIADYYRLHEQKPGGPSSKHRETADQLILGV